jgi:DnaJ-class molecular chaperone
LAEVFRAFAHEWFGTARDRQRERRVNGQRPDARRDDALATLDLEQPYTRAELKRRYITLVKRHHPDANGGSKESEERLKSINQAYTYLLDQVR